MNATARSQALQVPSELRPYQAQGVQFLYDSAAALLADEMGLGKTVQASIAISALVAEGGVGRAMIVSPASLTLNWERELAKWAPRLSVRRVTGNADERQCWYSLPVDVLVLSYEQVRIDALDRIQAGQFDLVVLDEAQRIKNRDSRTSFACRLLKPERAWALSATPLENSRADLEAVFSFLQPGLLSGRASRAELHERMAPHFLRRRKTDVLPDLPPVLEQELMLELSAEQQKAYDDIWFSREEALQGEEHPIQAVELFAVLTRLKQACNREPLSGVSCKLDALRLTIDAISTAYDKIIVFSQYVETLEWIASQLDNDVPVTIYHGGQSQTERDEIISSFETTPGPKVLLMSLRAGGVGLNLGSASTVVLFDRWWNPAVERQAIYRAHRFDRSQPLYVVKYLVQNTIEERINEILSKKQHLFDEYIEGAISAEGAGLSRAELMGILELQSTDTE